jgi:xanthine dehydrogenase molybdopterin-binding subunit B
MSANRIGTSPARVGGYERVTGGQQYVADIHLPDELHARLVTVDCARARIISIDTGAAELVPGVRLVMTAADLPQPVPRFGPQFEDRPVLAVGETKYHGEPVAAVAADTKDAAEEAARLVHVAYEELPAVFTIAAALDPAAPLVQDPALRPDDPLAGTNVLREHHFGWSDVDAVAASADLVVENTYTFPMVTQFAIEPHACIAAPDGDGPPFEPIQHPNWLQRPREDWPPRRRSGSLPDLGGGFGGKQHAKLEPLVAFMARAGRRLILTLKRLSRSAELDGDPRAVGFHGWHAGLPGHRVQLPVGGYADIADRTVTMQQRRLRAVCSRGANRGPSILSHTTPSTAFRGFGNPHDLGGGIQHDEAARPRHRPAELVCGTSPATARRSSPGPRRRRRWGADCPEGRRADRGRCSWPAGCGIASA